MSFALNLFIKLSRGYRGCDFHVFILYLFVFYITGKNLRNHGSFSTCIQLMLISPLKWIYESSICCTKDETKSWILDVSMSIWFQRNVLCSRQNWRYFDDGIQQLKQKKGLKRWIWHVSINIDFIKLSIFFVILKPRTVNNFVKTIEMILVQRFYYSWLNPLVHPHLPTWYRRTCVVFFLL